MKLPDDIPSLAHQIDQASMFISEKLNETLSNIQEALKREKGCPFASNVILHATGRLFAHVLTFVTTHNHDGVDTDPNVLHSIEASLAEFIGDAMKKYGTRDGAILLSIDRAKPDGPNEEKK